MATSYVIQFNLIRSKSTPALFNNIISKYQAVSDNDMVLDLKKDAQRVDEVSLETGIATGNEILSGEIFFTTDANRTTLKNQLGNPQTDIIDKCLAGSFIKLFTSTHFKDGNNINADSPCQVTNEWSN